MEERQSRLCFNIGAGAIGKAVAGPVFSGIGCRVVFADIDSAVVDDINRNGGYELICTEYGKPVRKQYIGNISAVVLGDKRAEELALAADYMCISIGSVGMGKFLPTLTVWIKKRQPEKPLYIFLMENDSTLKQVMLDHLTVHLGATPQWLHILQTSVERMTKNVVAEDGERSIITEQFFRVILEKAALAGSGLEDKSDFFEMVEDVKPYYYRKLYTNNLGHAVLGYIGQYRGYTNTVQAIQDPYISRILERVLDESGRMLICKFGFSKQEIDGHLEVLKKRFANSEMLDELSRLTRAPLRKLGKAERITGALTACEAYGIDAPGIMTTLFYVIEYCMDEKTLEPQIAKLIEGQGAGGVLEQICRIEKGSGTYRKVMERYKVFKPVR